ncbi:MAG TPA: 4Fe-4S dicluster domain-containing protein [Aliiroseovarius sp.]|nr:4Fe-4S dicluster domain-containing protein [Aliiroseovarius sp.]
MRGRLLASSCEACVQACPAEAITLAADDPELNPDLCSLCGGCVAACPEHVFALELPALRWADGKARFSPCPDHALSQAPLYLAPVQSLGMGELAVLWLQGVRDLEVAPGRCDDHLTPPLQEVAGRIKRFNALARARGLPGFTLSRATPAQARAWRDQADQP